MNMDCQQFQEHMDDYLDGSLALDDEADLHAHLDGCNHCREELQRAQALMEALRQVRVPPMSPGFAQRAIRQAVEQGNKPHKRAFVAGFSSALVAGVALLLVVGVFLPGGKGTVPSGTDAIAEVAISLETPQTVNLAFDVAHAMNDATLSISLPENVEVVGFPGLRQLSWQASLKQGRNILPLPLKGTANANGELLASIEQNGKKKTVRIQVRVEKQLAPHAETTPGLSWV
jgi:anti-sigma factor RsiW